MFPTAMFYVRYMNGIGHYSRTLEIIKNLKGMKTILLIGGPKVDKLWYPPNIRVIFLPSDPRDENSDRVVEIVERFRPSVFVTEFYPFARFESSRCLLPALKALQKRGAKIICSVRDIVYHNSMIISLASCDLINRYYSSVLVHSDPDLISLEDTFSLSDRIKIPIVHTGFISPEVTKSGIRHRGVCNNKKTVLVSVGGGVSDAGTYDMIQKCIESKCVIDRYIRTRFVIFAGKLLSNRDFLMLRRMYSKKDIVIRRFTSDFIGWLDSSDLSISRAGYNTCSNVLRTNTRALLIPFEGSEQPIRARLFETSGLARTLNETDFTADSIAETVINLLSETPPHNTFSLRGARMSARHLENSANTLHSSF